MRKTRGIFTRAFAAAIAIWVGALTVSPLPLDACPMHGSHALHAAQPGHAGHHAMSKHDGPSKNASRQCTCIGDCSTAASFAVIPPRQIAAPEARISTLLGGELSTQIVANLATREHVLPPANGPPFIS